MERGALRPPTLNPRAAGPGTTPAPSSPRGRGDEQASLPPAARRRALAAMEPGAEWMLGRKIGAQGRPATSRAAVPGALPPSEPRRRSPAPRSLGERMGHGAEPAARRLLGGRGRLPAVGRGTVRFPNRHAVPGYPERGHPVLPSWEFSPFRQCFGLGLRCRHFPLGWDPQAADPFPGCRALPTAAAAPGRAGPGDTLGFGFRGNG